MSEAPSTVALNFYVSPQGNDAWSGALAAPNRQETDGPFASLTRARDAVRELRGELSARGQQRPVTVLLREGTYEVTESLNLDPQDSGEEGAPVVWEAYPGEKPVISGGRRLTGFQPAEGGVWRLEIPEVQAGQWDFRDLWVNGERRLRPRLPREGLFPIQGAGTPDTKVIVYREGDLDPNWYDLGNVEIVHLQFWTEARMPIAALDPQAHTLTLAGNTWRPVTWSTGFWVENVREALAPGEWYLDRQAGVLTYWPLPGENPATAEVIAPVAERLLLVQGDLAAGQWVHDLTFRGLTFAYTAWHLGPTGYNDPQGEVSARMALTCEGVRRVSFEDCEVAHTGGYGLEFYRGCQDNRVVGNHLYDLGAGGIKVGETVHPTTEAGQTGHTTITDNYLHDGCQVYLGAPALWVGISSGNLVAHNEIQGIFDFGISVGWNWSFNPPSWQRDNVVEYNHVHHLGGGPLPNFSAIYHLGFGPGTVIRNNLLEYIYGYGLVLDEGSAGVLVENNLSHHTKYEGIGANFSASDNVVVNNIWALANLSTATPDKPPPGRRQANLGIFYNNVFYWNTGRPVRFVWTTFETNMDYNLYWDASGQPIDFSGTDFAGWQAKGLDRNSVLADPLFRDPEKGDFTWPEDSPLVALGMQPLDLSGVGPRGRWQVPGGHPPSPQAQVDPTTPYGYLWNLPSN